MLFLLYSVSCILLCVSFRNTCSPSFKSLDDRRPFEYDCSGIWHKVITVTDPETREIEEFKPRRPRTKCLQSPMSQFLRHGALSFVGVASALPAKLEVTNCDFKLDRSQFAIASRETGGVDHGF
jgi:hypothetical protein